MARRSGAGGRRQDFLCSIREAGSLSRSELCARHRLDKKTVSSLVDTLLADRLLVPAGFRGSAAGRPQELLAINGQHGNFIGIDLGGTHVIGIRADLASQALDRAFYEIRPGLPVDIILEQMKTICRRLVQSPAGTAPVRAIGICTPGFVDPGTGTSLVAENIPGWRDVRLGEIFAAEFGVPIAVEDSSRAFALAEKWLGAARGSRDFLLADLGYGIGMAIVVAGQLLRGSGNKSGEIGHTIVVPGGPPCTCGNRGCLETVASGRAIAEQAADGISAGRSELLRGLTHGDARAATAQDVAAAASMGDAFSAGLLRSAGRLAGLALANAVNILNPPLLVLGGGLLGTTTIMRDAIAEALREHCMKGIFEEVELRVSKLGIDGSALGCAVLASAGVFGRV